MKEKYFVHQIKRTNGVIDKGIVVKDSYEAARQTWHAYLGAYAYGQHAATDYVSCMITGVTGKVLKEETWLAPEVLL